jgi:hypothetical protein
VVDVGNDAKIPDLLHNGGKDKPCGMEFRFVLI